jgi:hypothetical protein
MLTREEHEHQLKNNNTNKQEVTHLQIKKPL